MTYQQLRQKIGDIDELSFALARESSRHYQQEQARYDNIGFGQRFRDASAALTKAADKLREMEVEFRHAAMCHAERGQ